MILSLTVLMSLIGDFWLNNPQYWIATGATRDKADKEIWERFHDINIDLEPAADGFSKVVYLDQFLRHFSRIVPISEDTIKQARIEAAAITDNTNLNLVSEEMLVWYLMPWKHLGMWDKLFKAIAEWKEHQGQQGQRLLDRFFMDSYIKAYTDDRVADGIIIIEGHAAGPFDHQSICESYPEKYWSADWSPAAGCLDLGLPELTSEPVAVSLSGGVDSMVLTALLHNRVAVHIVYGNRPESLLELEFIKEYTFKLGVRLYVYHIEWLRRDSTDRAFYERMTRSIRFSVYKAVGLPVVLGHIQDDVVENIWTNLAKGTNLDDLAKLSLESSENGVKLYRPWLNVPKSLIYEAAEKLGVPHLKNTTPLWSNRGKFRTGFYEATHKQYGSNVDTKIIEVAGRLKKQSDLVYRLLTKPILDSWDGKQLNITPGVNVELDGDGWLQIFTALCHSLGRGKPSWAACNDFSKRRLMGGMRINMRKDLKFTVIVKADQTWLRLGGHCGGP